MPKKILLADDSMTIQKVIKLTFAEEDFEVSVADDGEDAVNKAREMKPDIVLADVAMQVKNGYEICEAVKNAPETAGVPVLLLAGTFEPLDSGEAERVKADGHIVKPFESKELMDKVMELVERFPVTRPVNMAEGPGEEAASSPVAGVPEAAGGGEESIWGEGDFIKAPDAETGPATEETPELPDLEVFEGRAFSGHEAGEEKVTPAPVVERGEGFDEVDVISAEAPEMETAPGEAEGEASFDVEGFEENPFTGGTVENEPVGGAGPDTAGEPAGDETAPFGGEPQEEEGGGGEEPRGGEVFFGEGEGASEGPEVSGEKTEEEEEVEEGAAGEGGVTLSDEKVEEIVEKVARELVGEIARDVVPGLAREMVAEEIEKLREVLTKLKP